MAKWDGSATIKIDIMPIVALQCKKRDCKHNVFYECNLKTISISDGGKCEMLERINKMASIDFDKENGYVVGHE